MCLRQSDTVTGQRCPCGSDIPIALVDESRCYVAINDAAVDMFRYRREDVIGADRHALGPR